MGNINVNGEGSYIPHEFQTKAATRLLKKYGPCYYLGNIFYPCRISLVTATHL
jgi:hypothetical protein